MNGTAVGSPEQAPYVGNIKLLNDGTGLLRRALYFSNLVAVGEFVVIIILAIALVVSGTKRDRVHVMSIDHQANAATVYAIPEAGTKDAAPQHDLIAAYWLPIIVEHLFTVADPATNAANLGTFVGPYIKAGSPADAAINTYVRSPQNPNARSTNVRVQVVVDPLGPATRPDVYTLSWIATTRTATGAVLGRKRFTTQVSIAWGATRLRNVEDGKLMEAGNPVGLYISEIAIPDFGDVGTPDPTQ